MMNYMKIFRLENTIQPYPWGTYSSLEELFGIPNPDNTPQAEIWMGAHEKAPSRVLLQDNASIPLHEFIQKEPETILGRETHHTFPGQLPFLFKVLSAHKPLSVQAHPDKTQALEGYRREEAEGPAKDDPTRNYKDPNHKPELIYALTPFKALKGFRELPEIKELLDMLDIPGLRLPLQTLETHPGPQGLKDFYSRLMTLEGREKKAVSAAAVEGAKKIPNHDAFQTLLELQAEFPGDTGILSPLLLNLVYLEPGEALYLEAGVLHAYLGGTGMELMANSDNVLRGGLTPKHVDVAELLKVLSFHGGAPHRVAPVRTKREGERLYPTPAAEFDFSVIDIKNGTFRGHTEGAVEILFCGKGEGTIEIPGGHSPLQLKPGASYLVPAVVGPYTLQGTFTLYKAAVPAQ